MNDRIVEIITNYLPMWANKIIEEFAQAIRDAEWTDIIEGDASTLPEKSKDPLTNRRVVVYCEEYGEGDWKVQFGWYNHKLKVWFINGSPSYQTVTRWREIWN